VNVPTDLDPRPRPSTTRRWLSEARSWLSQARSWLSTHRAPASVVGGLAAASLLLWGGLVVASGDGPAATRGQQAAAPSPVGEDAGQDDAGQDDAGQEDAGQDDAPADGPDAAPTDPEPVPESDLMPELVAMPEPLDPDDHAPLDPTDADERWIVVLASYTRPTAAERDLRTRASDEDAALLWSSHYEGLTPELWVVFTGPFPDREAALDAADARGGDAYARELAPPADG
jgi:hypothetical protein